MDINSETLRNNQEKLLVSAKEAARMLSVSPRTLWTWTRDGRVKCIRIGDRAIRYAVDDLREAIEQHRAEVSN